MPITLDRSDCYWIGFLLGDGTVTEHPETGTLRLKLTLSSTDSEHVREFSDWFGGEYKIREIEETGETSVSVYDQDKIEWLVSLGVKQNKTETVRLPDLRYTSDLIRGYSDADGYIGKPGGSGYRWAIASNSVGVLEDIEEKVPFGGGEIVTNNTAGTNYLRYGSVNHADYVADFLYPDGIETEPALDRKKESALQCAAWSIKKEMDKPLEYHA